MSLNSIDSRSTLLIVHHTRRTVSSKVADHSPDYSSLQSDKDRKVWSPKQPIAITKTAKPDWRYGEGANSGDNISRRHVGIDPHAEGRPMFHNYTLLISGIAPRPVGFLSTMSKDGKENLSPFSYFQVVDHDPPVFVVGFSGRASRPKDTLRNLEETGECVINTVSEHMVEAVNASSLDAPYGVSEWELSGLHQAASTTVKPKRVQESIFSVEGKVLRIIDYDTINPSKGSHGRLAVIEGTKFWVRDDAINDSQSEIDLEVLRPVGQLGGVQYARMTETFELPRSNWASAMEHHGPQLTALTAHSNERHGP